jgi:hypothetical protein
VFSSLAMLNRDLLGAVATGQQQRNISDISIRGYLSKMHVLTRKLNDIEDLRLDALEFDNDGNPKRHLNAARNVIKLKLPMEVETGRLLFAALSIDGSLKRRQRGAIETNEAEAHQLPEDRRNLGANISTVSAQTYQNYKSALKWWHEYTNADFDKAGSAFPPEVDKAINTQILTYKRDVASKKRRGIMSPKEGKSPYSLQGYVEICSYFMKMRPISIRYTWMEGLTGTIHHWPHGDGRFHRVPFGFKWPSYNTSTIWNLWHFGDASRGIGPYKLISRAHDLTTTLCKTNHSRTRVVINALISFAIRDQMITTASDINQNNSQHIFDHVMPLLIEDLYPELHERPIDLNINTLSNRKQKHHHLTGRN